MVVGNFVMFRDGGKQHMYACLRMNEIHGNNVVSTAYSHVDKYYYSLPKKQITSKLYLRNSTGSGRSTKHLRIALPTMGLVLSTVLARN